MHAAAVEIGTGSGVGSLYLLSGMHPDGVLTTIDLEVENQRAAREAFAEAEIRSPRVRTISGRPRDVVSRLTDHAYDLVSFPAHTPHALDLLEHARRLLRPGGVLVIPHALFHDRVADPTRTGCHHAGRARTAEDRRGVRGPDLDAHRQRRRRARRRAAPLIAPDPQPAPR